MPAAVRHRPYFHPRRPPRAGALRSVTALSSGDRGLPPRCVLRSHDPAGTELRRQSEAPRGPGQSLPRHRRRSVWPLLRQRRPRGYVRRQREADSCDRRRCCPQPVRGIEGKPSQYLIQERAATMVTEAGVWSEPPLFPAVFEDSNKKSLARLLNALGSVRVAEARASDARRELRRMMRHEIASSRVTEADLARAFGVSQRRIKQMLNDKLD
jgi:hypothetical protein